MGMQRGRNKQVNAGLSLLDSDSSRNYSCSTASVAKPPVLLFKPLVLNLHSYCTQLQVLFTLIVLT